MEVQEDVGNRQGEGGAETHRWEGRSKNSKKKWEVRRKDKMKGRDV